ncbi:helix-turn-helix domain-containing protein [Streptomyces sp. NPDC049555]|uniref:nSTAND1 domain-containing NTPase n=1 Tax=Streptomyces sp. NPDC049555 TaxID=3154930 RepID=UPI00342E550F
MEEEDLGTGERTGELLRRLRRDRGLSLAELARRAFYSKGYVSKVENGEKPLTLELGRVCDQVLQTGGTLESAVLATAKDNGGRKRDTGVCPYPGLSPFGVRDARWFFGRRDAVADLVAQLSERLRTPGPLLVTAPSGAGKSSLLRAGLIPALARGVLPVSGSRNWPVTLLTPGERPLDALVERMSVATGASRQLLDKARQEGADAFAAAVGAALPDEGAAPIVVVDQFEETFMLCPDAHDRAAFVDALTALTAPRGTGAGALPTALVVLGVRADFYDRCLAFPGLAASLQRGHITLGPMGDAQLRDAVTGPAREAGLEVEPGLVEVLLRDLGHLPGRAAPGHAAQGGALPLLSHALLGTWQHRENSTLTVEGYRLTGGVYGAVAATAERAYASLPAHRQQAARRVLLHLVQVGDDRETSRPGRRADLVEAGADADGDAEAVVEAFTRARLLTVDADHVEVAHEALLHAWPRLRQWIEEDRAVLRTRQALAEAAAAWEREGRDPSLLHRGSRLAAALEVAGHPSGAAALPTTARRFLEAGVEREQSEKRTEQRRLRNLRTLTAGLATLLVLSLVAGAAALHQSRMAQDQRRVAESRELAARATGMLRDQPEAAMLVALSAYRRSPTAEARSSLLSTYAAFPGNQLTSHTDDVFAVAFSPDSRTLATASDDHTAKLWDAASRRLLATLTGHTDRVRAVAFSPDGRTVATAGRDRTVKLWDARTHRPIVTLTGHAGAVNGVAFAPDGRTLATAGDDGTVRLWDVAARRSAGVLDDGNGAVWRVAYAPDGRTLAATYTDQKVRLWDTASRHVAATLSGHTAAVTAVAFSPDGRSLATGGLDRTARLWDLASRRMTATLSGHRDIVWSVAFSPDGRTLATAGYNDDTARLWDTTTHEAVGALTGAGTIPAVAFSPDGRSLVTTSTTEQRGTTPTLQLWDASSRQKTGTLVAGGGTATAVALSPDRRTLAAGDARGTVVLWDMVAGSVVTTLAGPAGAVTSLAFSPDGRALAGTSDDGTARLWETTTYREAATLTGHGGAVLAAAFSPDGRTLATAGADRSTRLWDVRSHEAIAVLDGEPEAVASLAFSPDGRTLATGNHDASVRLWDLRSRKVVATLTRSGPMCRTYSLAFGPDGTTLAATSCDVTVWDVAARQRITRLTGHTETVSHLAYTPDGTTLATAGYDRTIRLWDTRTHRPVATLTGTGGYVSGLASSPSGHTLATVNSDRTVRIWELDPAAIADSVCRLGADHHWNTTLAKLPTKNPCG